LLRKSLIIAKFLTVGTIAGTLLGVVGTGIIAKQRRSNTVAEWRMVPVTPPAGTPKLKQESIDLALAIYGIEVPETAYPPKLNVNLEDRGLSSRFAWAEKIQVEIGPAAFESWGLLASTLAHELEVHCQQNFALIGMMDFLRLDGTLRAERQAYLHELRNARRFGLSPESQDLIANTMDYYYRLDESEHGPVAARMSKTLGRWLARDFDHRNVR
jgi:hypothetical protein